MNTVTDVDTKPSKKRSSVCHSCKRPVLWVLLDGKRQPLDHLEEPAGDVALVPELLDKLLAPDERSLPVARFVSGVKTRFQRHIKSCPDAEKWRERWKRTAQRPYSKIERKKTR